MSKKDKITVQGTEITVISEKSSDYISLTDIARVKNPDANSVIANWMRNRNTIEYLGIWEYLYNPNFKPLEFEGFKNEAGANAFTLSPQKWIENANAIGIISKSGRYGGTFAHKDIAFKFASWRLFCYRQLTHLLPANDSTAGSRSAICRYQIFLSEIPHEIALMPSFLVNYP